MAISTTNKLSRFNRFKAFAPLFLSHDLNIFRRTSPRNLLKMIRYLPSKALLTNGSKMVPNFTIDSKSHPLNAMRSIAYSKFSRFCEIFVENDLTDSVLTTPKYLQVQNVIVYLFVFQGELINLVKI